MRENRADTFHAPYFSPHHTWVGQAIQVRPDWQSKLLASITGIGVKGWYRFLSSVPVEVTAAALARFLVLMYIVSEHEGNEQTWHNDVSKACKGQAALVRQEIGPRPRT